MDNIAANEYGVNDILVAHCKVEDVPKFKDIEDPFRNITCIIAKRCEDMTILEEYVNSSFIDVRKNLAMCGLFMDKLIYDANDEVRNEALSFLLTNNHMQL